jgi:hypothetical protein
LGPWLNLLLEAVMVAAAAVFTEVFVNGLWEPDREV